MIYKGSPSITCAVYCERDELGAWVTTYEFQGTQSAMAALAGSFVPGPKINYQNRQSGWCTVTVTYGNFLGNDVYIDRWEIDRENIDRDIMFLPAFTSLTDNAKQEIKRWRADPSSDLDTTKGDPVLMGQVRSLIVRGVEAFQVSTLILKRTRVLNASAATAIDLSERTSFYSTARLIALQAIPSTVSTRLPSGGPAIPSDAAWGWLPRLSNRAYVGRGLCEEQSDWVFAGWSKFVYSYVP